MARFLLSALAVMVTMHITTGDDQDTNHQTLARLLRGLGVHSSFSGRAPFGATMWDMAGDHSLPYAGGDEPPWFIFSANDEFDMMVRRGPDAVAAGAPCTLTLWLRHQHASALDYADTPSAFRFSLMPPPRALVALPPVGGGPTFTIQGGGASLAAPPLFEYTEYSFAYVPSSTDQLLVASAGHIDALTYEFHPVFTTCSPYPGPEILPGACETPDVQREFGTCVLLP